MIQVSQRVEWQRTTRWACCNRELAGDSFHRVLWFLLYVLWMKDVCQWTYLYRRKGKKGLSCSKIDQNPMVSVSFSSILFSSFFFFFSSFSSYKWIYGSIRVPVSCLLILELRDAEAKYGRRESFSRDMLIFHKLSRDNYVNENDLWKGLSS